MQAEPSLTVKPYAQIEKQLLSAIFGLEWFHQFTYGRQVNVQTDHKPLEMIVLKPLYLAPKRLQRMLMRLQTYDVKVSYHQGKEVYLADTLSRAYLLRNCKIASKRD